MTTDVVGDESPTTSPAAAAADWRTTLYIWDGIVSIEEEAQQDDAEGTTVRWGGTWVPVLNVPDATLAGVPHRDAFQEFVDSECKFMVAGEATRTKVTATDSEKKRKREEEETIDETGKDDDDVEQFYVVHLAQGDGWDMLEEAATAGDAGEKSSEQPKQTQLKTKHHDTVHNVLVKTLRWSGNQLDQSQDLLVAHGRNDFGAFVSVGWQRPGCRWTVARRYLPDEDPRTTWSLPDLYTAMVDGRCPDANNNNEKMTTTLLTIVPTTGQRVLTIPPWKANAVLHRQYQHGSKNHRVQTKKKK